MPNIFLIETKNSTVLSQGIRLFSKYPYNHLSIALDASLSSVYSFGRRQPNNPLIAGFAKEDFSHAFYSQSLGRVHALSVTEEEWQKIALHLKFFETYPLDWHYNLLGLVPAYFHYSWERSGHFFCSEFVATLLQSAGILSPYMHPSLMHPKDVVEAVHPVCIYDGHLQKYPELIQTMSTSEFSRRRYLRPIRSVYRQFTH
ncbi:hypothetical protein SAMN04488100_11123 [Alkalibacterium putridalgicola]|uniref:Permuted papain-like amidase enzyme, YaeF/YiiX, C92 family n=1 Tax=Alkalibacterium putridalgicola TaxID=426703 RepID=A0A1H7T6K7_9LACT|nr:hypothetical protein [Alkalibacterium putridalgicola]GEK89336.1 hypothetical protein APU01nite_13750 [Alkalibacterium putridalgicola]SEL80413.1 hypothetical protein SAMN04488100_11123 [Alkalibacterium putridalgicola]